MLRHIVITASSGCISCNQSIFQVYFRSHSYRFRLCTFFHITAAFIVKKQFHGRLVRLHCVWRWMPCLYVALAGKAGAVCRNALPLVLSVWEEQRRLVLWRLDVHSWPISVLLSRLHFCNFSLFLSTEVACNNKLFIFLEENNRISPQTVFLFCLFFFCTGSFEQEGNNEDFGWVAH